MADRIIYAWCMDDGTFLELLAWEIGVEPEIPELTWEGLISRDGVFAQPRALTSPHRWQGDWKITEPAMSRVPHNLCAECDGPAFFDYLCKTCRETL